LQTEQGKKRSTSWHAFLDKQTPRKNKPGRNWLTVNEFAKRAEAVLADVVDKIIAKQVTDIVVVKTKGTQRDKRVFVNWNTEGYNYVYRFKDEESWPIDFIPNEAKEYRQIADEVDVKRKAVVDTAMHVDSLAKVKNINNNYDAKLTKLKIEIEEKLIANRIANNEVIAIEHVMEAANVIAYETKAMLQVFVDRVAPSLVPQLTEQQVIEILYENLEDTLAALMPITLTSTYTEEEQEQDDSETWET